jgi:hypothetical protein
MFDDYTAYAVINKINTRSKLPVRVAFFVFWILSNKTTFIFS